MIKITTDIGQGEVITIRGGPVPAIHPSAKHEFVATIPLPTVAMNIAHWTEELRQQQARYDELSYQAREVYTKQIAPLHAHLQRLQARLSELTPLLPKEHRHALPD